MAAKYAAVDKFIDHCSEHSSDCSSHDDLQTKSVSFQLQNRGSDGQDAGNDKPEQIMLKNRDHLVAMRDVTGNDTLANESGSEVEMSDVDDGSSVQYRSKALTDPASGLSKRKVLQLSLDDTTGSWKVVSKSKLPNLRRKLGLNSLAVMFAKRKEPDYYLKAVVALLFVTIVSTIITTTIVYKKQQIVESLESQVFFWDQRRQFDLLNKEGKLILKGHYGRNIPEDLAPAKCISIDKDGELNEICRDWKYRTHLDINYEANEDGVCYHVHWRGYADNTVLRDCFDLGHDYWYGMGDVTHGKWPLNGLSISTVPFVTGHKVRSQSPFGAIIKRYWLSSSGVTIRVPLNVPLYISFNDTKNPGQLCLEAKTSQYPYDAVEKNQPHLDYSICSGHDMISIHRESTKNWIKKSTNIFTTIDHERYSTSSKVFVETPIWATTPRTLPLMSQAAVVDFADSILEYGFEPGFILLDSRWEQKTGQLQTDKVLFPNFAALVTVLKNKGFKMLLTMSPFVDISADVLAEACQGNRILSDPHLDVPLLTQCYGKGPGHMCALLDMMNATSREWFRKRIKAQILKPLLADGFLFKGVQVSLMPHHIHGFKHHIINPDYFQMYYKNVARHMSPLVGMDTAVGVQRLDAYYQLLPSNSSWEDLRKIIPRVLSLGLIGYSTLNPGSVGGDIVPLDPKLFDRELYIRWLQVAMFFPVLQLSSPPGSETNDIEIIKLNKRLLKIRNEQVLSVLKHGQEESREYGTSIIRPLFFVEPGAGPDVYQISDQFAVREDIIVAPVLERGARSRDIYLPVGWWRDEISSHRVRGGKWLRDYPVPLERVAFFTRIPDEGVDVLTLDNSNGVYQVDKKTGHELKSKFKY